MKPAETATEANTIASPPSDEPGAAAAGHEADAGEREQVAGPGQRAGRPVPQARGQERHEHGHGRDEQRRVGHVGAGDAGVLQDDDQPEADGARRRRCPA